MNEMNCYEFVLYSAWRLGQLTTEQIVGMYDGGVLGIPKWEDLGYDANLPVVDPASGAGPAVGDFVFITDPGKDTPWHAVLSLGSDTAASLWMRPQRDTPASRVKLSDYARSGKTLQYGPPQWL